MAGISDLFHLRGQINKAFCFYLLHRVDVKPANDAWGAGSTCCWFVIVFEDADLIEDKDDLIVTHDYQVRYRLGLNFELLEPCNNQEDRRRLTRYERGVSRIRGFLTTNDCLSFEYLKQ
jgi:hypothetical protein